MSRSLTTSCAIWKGRTAAATFVCAAALPVECWLAAPASLFFTRTRDVATNARTRTRAYFWVQAIGVAPEVDARCLLRLVQSRSLQSTSRSFYRWLRYVGLSPYYPHLSSLFPSASPSHCSSSFIRPFWIRNRKVVIFCTFDWKRVSVVLPATDLLVLVCSFDRSESSARLKFNDCTIFSLVLLSTVAQFHGRSMHRWRCRHKHVHRWFQAKRTGELFIRNLWV